MFIFSGHLPRHQKRTALKKNSQLTALIFWEHTSWFLTNAAAPLTDTHIYLHTESFANTKIKSASIVVYLRLSFYNILTPCIKVENSVTYLYSAFFSAYFAFHSTHVDATKPENFSNHHIRDAECFRYLLIGDKLHISFSKLLAS